MEKVKKRIYKFGFIILFLVARFSFAATPPPETQYIYTLFGVVAIDPNVGTPELSKYFNQFLLFLYGLAGACAVMLIIVAGFQIMASRDNPKETAAAKQRITYALYGVVIIFCAWIVLKIIGGRPMLTWGF